MRFHDLIRPLTGFGTSNDSDTRLYFSNMTKHLILFAPTQEGDKELIDPAFSKKKADERKEWLRQFKVGRIICVGYAGVFIFLPTVRVSGRMLVIFLICSSVSSGADISSVLVSTLYTLSPASLCKSRSITTMSNTSGSASSGTLPEFDQRLGRPRSSSASLPKVCSSSRPPFPSHSQTVSYQSVLMSYKALIFLKCSFRSLRV
jgi:hypothetical protein